MLIKDNETNDFMEDSNEDYENWELVSEEPQIPVVDTTTTEMTQGMVQVEEESTTTHVELPFFVSPEEQPAGPVSEMLVVTEIEKTTTTPAQDISPESCVPPANVVDERGAVVLDEYVDEGTAAASESTPLLLDSQMKNTETMKEPKEKTDDVAPHDDTSSSTTAAEQGGTRPPVLPMLDKAVLEETLRVAKRKIRNTVKDLDENAHKIQESTVSGLKQVGASAKALGEILRQDIDEQAHKLQETTVSGLKQAGASVKSLGETLRHETETVTETVKRVYVEKDVPAKANAAAVSVKETACQFGRDVKRFNDKYHVTDKIATAAVFVGALALAKGNHRNGASALAMAGASFMAGEAMRSPAHASTELNENLHLD